MQNVHRWVAVRATHAIRTRSKWCGTLGRGQANVFVFTLADEGASRSTRLLLSSVRGFQTLEASEQPSVCC